MRFSEQSTSLGVKLAFVTALTGVGGALASVDSVEGEGLVFLRALECREPSVGGPKPQDHRVSFYQGPGEAIGLRHTHQSGAERAVDRYPIRTINVTTVQVLGLTSPDEGYRLVKKPEAQYLLLGSASLSEAGTSVRFSYQTGYSHYVNAHLELLDPKQGGVTLKKVPLWCSGLAVQPLQK